MTRLPSAGRKSESASRVRDEKGLWLGPGTRVCRPFTALHRCRDLGHRCGHDERGESTYGGECVTWPKRVGARSDDR